MLGGWTDDKKRISSLLFLIHVLFLKSPKRVFEINGRIVHIPK